MATGDLIQYSTFSSSQTRNYSSGEVKGSWSRYLYCSAPSIAVHLSCNGAWLTTASFSCTFKYYNWNTGSWVTAGTISGSARGASEATDKWFYHNRSGHSDTYSGTSGFNLWRMYMTGDSGTGGYSSSRIIVELYSCGGMSSSQYNSLCKENFIVSAGRLTGDAMHVPGSSSDDANAVNIFRWSNDTGTPISWSLMHKVMPKAW